MRSLKIVFAASLTLALAACGARAAQCLVTLQSSRQRVTIDSVLAAVQRHRRT